MSALDQPDYKYIDEISDELKCPICREPYESPVSVSGCHCTFCEKCIKEWLNRKKTCPTCQRKLVRSSEQSDRKVRIYKPINTRIVSNQLGELRIQCVLCNQTNIQRCHWNNHQAICSEKIIFCASADNKCSWQGTRESLAEHLKTCPFEQVRPIIDELKNKLELTRTNQLELQELNQTKQLELQELTRKNQSELQELVDTHGKKVTFLLNIINHGDLMKKICTKPKKCKYYDESKQNSKFTCSNCYTQIQRKDISLHACSGSCICRPCVESHYSSNEDEDSTSSEEELSTSSEENN